jgi:hypothetical protein
LLTTQQKERGFFTNADGALYRNSGVYSPYSAIVSNINSSWYSIKIATFSSTTSFYGW